MVWSESKSLTVAYNLRAPDAVAQAIRAADGFARAAGLSAGAAMRLAIVVEELVVNIFEHGGLREDQCVEFGLSRTGGDVSLTIEDPGQFFDPRSAPEPGEQPPERGGGAGLAMVRAWGRILSYEATGGNNRLEMILPAGDEKEQWLEI